MRRFNLAALLTLSVIVAVLFCFSPVSVYAACTGSSPTWTCSADTSSTDLQTCINNATAGDTINIGSGSGSWNTQITLSKAINIIGAGVGNTVITNTRTTSHTGSSVEESNYLIIIKPSVPSSNPKIRFSGMTIHFGATNYGIIYTNSSTTSPLTNVRLDHLYVDIADHNHFIFQRTGLVFGVWDHSTIAGGLMDIAGSSTLWNTFGYEFGNIYNFYFEDNTWTTYNSTQNMVQAGNGACNYAFRYNTITYNSTATLSPLFDMHGNQTSSAASGFGAEIYGNAFSGATITPFKMDQRGGKWLVFDNKVTGASGQWYRVREESSDSYQTYPVSTVNGQPQHISNSYSWSNWYGSTPIVSDDSGEHVTCPVCSEYVPTENQHFWNYNASFDGTTGVGCGPLASRPITCTPGVGYWATTQSCTDLTGIVGADHTTSISGTLYKCSPSGTWASFYTPFTYPHPLIGRQFYVSPGGLGTTCTSGSPCALSYANANAVAGDTVYLSTGSYTTSYIAPTNSGTSDSSRITYTNYNGTVSIDNQAYAVYLNGNDYITVTGINGSGYTQGVVITNAANYNIISYGIFGPAGNATAAWDTSHIRGNSQYNWVHHCTFYHGGENVPGSPGNDRGMVFEIGEDSSNAHYAYYNLIEDSIFYHGGHHVFGLQVKNNTVRNNYFHNEAWENSYGNRVIYSNGYESGAGIGECLVEGNKIAYSYFSIDAPTSPVGIFVVASPYNIIRYNKIYHGIAYGTAFYTWPASPWDSRGAYNRFYNNTLYNNGYAITGGSEDSAVWFGNTTYSVGNILKNNLYYSHYQVYGGTTSGQTFANEYNGDVSGNPLFINASPTPPSDKTDSTVPNLDLQAGSPAINTGGSLTTVAVADTSTGTSLIVSNDDARYFQYGQWAPPGKVSADWIAVGTVSNTVQISSINYSTNTITLANSISRNDGDPVWLYRKSDGVRVLYGTAPDAGAFEYPSGGDLTPPTVIITTNGGANFSTQATSFLLEGTASDAVGVTSCKWRLTSPPNDSNGTALTGTTVWYGTVTGLLLGDNLVYAGCTDAPTGGNWGSDVFTVTRTTTQVLGSPKSLTGSIIK